MSCNKLGQYSCLRCKVSVNAFIYLHPYIFSFLFNHKSLTTYRASFILSLLMVLILDHRMLVKVFKIHHSWILFWQICFCEDHVRRKGVKYAKGQPIPCPKCNYDTAETKGLSMSSKSPTLFPLSLWTIFLKERI